MTRKLSSPLTFTRTNQWGQNWLLTFNTCKTRLRTFDHQADNTEFSPAMVVLSMRLLAWNMYWSTSSLPDLKSNLYIQSITKNTGRLPMPLQKVSGFSYHTLSLSLQEPDQAKSHFRATTEFKGFCRCQIVFYPSTFLPQTERLLASGYFQSRRSSEILSLVPAV